MKSRIVSLFCALALIAAACSSDGTGGGVLAAPDAAATDDSDSDNDSDEDNDNDENSDIAVDEPDDVAPIEPDADVIAGDDPVPGGEVGQASPPSDIAWEPCGSIECATIDVPADYENPEAGTISIAINRVAASDPAQRRGVLLVNPGGPGASGRDLAQRFVGGSFPAEVTDAFDVIGFDPRGVGQSEPTFACGESGEQLGLLSQVDGLIDEPAEVTLIEEAIDLCVESMGDVAGLIHTGYVVRDMDEIRQALGEDQISYLGFSYGSLIGVWYATLFPDNVRAMVIDGADNPLDDLSDFDARLQSTREEIAPIEELLEEALGACADDTCPIFNGGDPVGAYLETVPLFDIVNEANADNPTAGFLGLITPLYQEAAWPTLWEALADLRERQDPTLFSELAEFQLGPDPSAPNITPYVNCLDGWALRPELDREARLDLALESDEIEAVLEDEFPLLFALEGELASPCDFMDVLGTPALDVPLDGGGVPILVVGNTSDPVTSFGESEELVEETLANGVLVEVDHSSHVVYPANPCVNDVVHGVLLNVSFPQGETVCERVSEVETLLVDVCIQLAPQFETALSGGELREACQGFASEGIDRLGEETALDALDGLDDEAAGLLLSLLEEAIL